MMSLFRLRLHHHHDPLRLNPFVSGLRHRRSPLLRLCSNCFHRSYSVHSKPSLSSVTYKPPVRAISTPAAAAAARMVKAIRVHEVGGPEAYCNNYCNTKSLVRALSVSATAKMVKAIRVHEVGGPEVLKWEDVEIGEPKEGEIRVKNKAVGLNFIDVYFRKGSAKAPVMPFTPGMEAVGVVAAVGSGVTGTKVGDLVAYAGFPMGSYTEEQILPADKVVPVPSTVDPLVAASVMLKGMTAQYLVRRCFKVEPGHTILVHAAAGGVGSLLCQWANALGATVIGTVSTKEKAAQAKDDGCHHVIIYKDEDFVARVNEITSGKGVEVVYDAVGKDTFQGSLACLKFRGYLVSYGQSSGMPDPLPLPALGVKSLFLTRPSLMQYTATREELLECAGDVFANIASGVLRVRVNHSYPLSKSAQAHSDLENRKTTGSVVLIPDGAQQ